MSGPHATENTNPEKFADFLLAYAQRTDETISELARRCGLNRETARLIVERLEGVYQPVTATVRKVTTETLISKIEDKLPLLLDAVDEEKVEKATLRDIAVALGVFVEKRQLLKGEPTQILTYEERTNLNQIAPYIIKELERRGMPVDVTYREVPTVSIAPPDRTDDAALSKTAANKARRENRAKNR